MVAFRENAPSSAAAVGAAVKAVEIADCDVATAGGQADSAMGRGKGAESGRVQAGNTAPWARSSLLRGTHPTAGAAQETQPAVGPHTVQFFDEQAVGTESARVDLHRFVPNVLPKPLRSVAPQERAWADKAT